MKIKTILYLVLVPILLLGSCQKTELEIRPDQVAYFEYEYVNHAWGYQHNGWIVDKTGKILGYNLPDSWTFPDSAGYISEPDLEKNLSKTDTLYNYQISTTELTHKIKLIPGAAKGKLSERKNVMFDAGGWGFSCYIWDKNKHKYRKILLETKGDWEQYNQSPGALSLVTWLKGINELL